MHPHTPRHACPQAACPASRPWWRGSWVAAGPAARKEHHSMAVSPASLQYHVLTAPGLVSPARHFLMVVKQHFMHG
eukprot:363391-Chlamydomonas_euryale.AAC.2